MFGTVTCRFILAFAACVSQCLSLPAQNPTETISAEELQLLRAVEDARIATIERVLPSVVAIYGHDRRGGGSGVVIDANGLALTNHHVIAAAGVSGLGGLADGILYRWELIGTDPGGDVALIQLHGRTDFPFSRLGDSDQVRVGDWALALGNPFLLATDQVPTVTLGIVSGVQRYQGGSAGNQLVYGNCIQVDSSINPGNSGGPLFNMLGEVIGINGRGSFRDRGRVNVGLGYAISSNQIKNFLPDLLATKLVEHGTLDASFIDREGKVICSTVYLDAPVAVAGLAPGDELLEFEGCPITHANQFTNLICTLPEDWPVHLKIRKEDGREISIDVRLFGLPYNTSIEAAPEEKPGEEQPEPDKPKDAEDQEKAPGDKKMPGDEGPKAPDVPDEQSQEAQRDKLRALMTSEAGVVLSQELNQRFADYVVHLWRDFTAGSADLASLRVARIDDEILQNEERIGTQTLWLATDGRFRVDVNLPDQQQTFGYDGRRFWMAAGGQSKELSLIEAKTSPLVYQGLCLVAPFQLDPMSSLGRAVLDGSGKAQQRVTYRMMYLDEDEDWFYCWLSLHDRTGNPQVQLLKASSNRNCESDQGMIFGNWQARDELQFPFEKHLVEGLNEQVIWTARTTGFRWIENPSEESFEMPASTGDGTK